jgi:hypothetical protein
MGRVGAGRAPDDPRHARNGDRAPGTSRSGDGRHLLPTGVHQARVEDVVTRQADIEKVAEELAASLAAALQPLRDTISTSQRSAQQHQLARELCALLHSSGKDSLNERAKLVLRCPKRRRVAYRVFEIHGRLLGISAHEPWLADGMDVWVRLPDWLPTSGDLQLDGRCPCCRRTHRIALAQIHREIQTGRRSAVITAVPSQQAAPARPPGP